MHDYTCRGAKIESGEAWRDVTAVSRQNVPHCKLVMRSDRGRNPQLAYNLPTNLREKFMRGISDGRDDDDDSGVDLKSYCEDRGPCWSCQHPMSGSMRPVCLESDIVLPVCPECWQSMSVADRLQLAIQFMDRWQGDAAAWRDMLGRLE